MKINLKMKRRYNGSDVGPGIVVIEDSIANDWIQRKWAIPVAGEGSEETVSLEDMSIAALYKKAQELGVSVKSQSSYRKDAGKAALISLIEEAESEDDSDSGEGEGAEDTGEEDTADSDSGENDSESGPGDEG